MIPGGRANFSLISLKNSTNCLHENADSSRGGGGGGETTRVGELFNEEMENQITGLEVSNGEMVCSEGTLTNSKGLRGLGNSLWLLVN